MLAFEDWYKCAWLAKAVELKVSVFLEVKTMTIHDVAKEKHVEDK